MFLHIKGATTSGKVEVVIVKVNSRRALVEKTSSLIEGFFDGMIPGDFSSNMADNILTLTLLTSEHPDSAQYLFAEVNQPLWW